MIKSTEILHGPFVQFWASHFIQLYSCIFFYYYFFFEISSRIYSQLCAVIDNMHNYIRLGRFHYLRNVRLIKSGKTNRRDLYGWMKIFFGVSHDAAAAGYFFNIFRQKTRPSRAFSLSHVYHRFVNILRLIGYRGSIESNASSFSRKWYEQAFPPFFPIRVFVPYVRLCLRKNAR